MPLSEASQSPVKVSKRFLKDTCVLTEMPRKGDVNAIPAICRLLFVGETLKMELSEEKTLITHSSQSARFLGYDIAVRRNSAVKPNGQGYKQRTLNNKVELTVPLQDKIEKFLFSNSIVKQENGKLEPVCRTKLLKLSDLEILTAVNSEVRGVFAKLKLSQMSTKSVAPQKS